MAVNPQHAIEIIARHYVQGGIEDDANLADRPFPGHRIPVVPVLTRHTPLLAVVWNQVDADIMDNVLNIAGDTTRVVYTLTTIAQQRLPVARMTDWLASTVPYADAITFTSVPEPKNYRKEYDQAEDYVSQLRDYNDSFITPPVPQFTTVPERQLQRLVALPPLGWPVDYSDVIVYNTVCEGTQLDYMPAQDWWQGEVALISHVGTRGVDHA